jgi:hypothetical protein
MGTWTPTSPFGTWGIGDLWKFVKTSYNSSKTLGCETLLYMIHGAQWQLSRRGNNVGGDHAKSQSTWSFWISRDDVPPNELWQNTQGGISSRLCVG